jgi:hypothetical protein
MTQTLISVLYNVALWITISKIQTYPKITYEAREYYIRRTEETLLQNNEHRTKRKRENKGT